VFIIYDGGASFGVGGLGFFWSMSMISILFMMAVRLLGLVGSVFSGACL